MKLAQDETRITLGNEVITLRPTLRAALRLERRFGGFDKMLRSLMDGSISTMVAIVAEGSNNDARAITLIDTLHTLPLYRVIETLTDALLAFVLVLAGIDPEAELPKDDKARQASRMTFADYHAKLFRLATGWLGWAPDDAWRATPAEITEAYAGRVEMLQAIFGGGSKEQTRSDVSLDEKFRLVFGSMTSVHQRMG